jgi:hypothetical protein
VHHIGLLFYTVVILCYNQLLADPDTVLFNSAQDVRHCLHSLLQTEKNMHMALTKAHTSNRHIANINVEKLLSKSLSV